MAGIGSLVDSVTGAFDSVFGAESSKAYPSGFEYITNQANYTNGSWKDSSLKYAFDVVRVFKQTGNSDGFYPGWLPFFLQINPQNLNQDEIFAIKVTPTFRGVIVEHQGSVLKDIQISGTTGISPFKKEGGVDRTTGKPILGSGRSGYEEFNELRSYFRTYVEAKRLDNNPNYEMRLVFRNYKDNEHLYVEPQKFSMKRDSQRRTLYNYDISLKAIGVVEVPSIKPDLLTSVLSGIDSALRYIELAEQYINAGVGLIKSIERDITATILGPLQKLNDVLTAFDSGVEAIKNFGSGIGPAINQELDEFAENVGVGTDSGQINFTKAGLTRRDLENTAANAARVRDNLAEAIGIDMTAYNGAADRVATSTGVSRDPTIFELETLHGLMLMARSPDLQLAYRDAFEPDVNQEFVNASSFYEDVNIPVPNSVRMSKVKGGDTIQIIAARELGNVDRYRELIVLNNLISPYIDTISSQGVLAPGDEILIPQNSTTGDMGIRSAKDYNVTNGMTESEKALGVDLRLDDNNDIALTNTGDLDVHAGMTNYAQAIIIRMSLEPRSLKRHPSIGVDLKIGEKARTNRINQVRDQIIRSISSDSRTESVPFLEVEQNSGTIGIKMLVKPKNLEQNLPVPVTLNTD